MSQSGRRRVYRTAQETPPPAGSVRALDVTDEAVEVRAVELGDGAVVLVHPPRPEVEVDVRDTVLDRRPERPAVLRHEPPQAGPGDLVHQVLAVVVADKLVELREREARLAPDVAEL